jgi:hypothetical protein
VAKTSASGLASPKSIHAGRAKLKQAIDAHSGKIFLSANKSGSAADSLARHNAICCSIASQSEADLERCRSSHCNRSELLAAALDIAKQAEGAEGGARTVPMFVSEL